MVLIQQKQTPCFPRKLGSSTVFFLTGIGPEKRNFRKLGISPLRTLKCQFPKTRAVSRGRRNTGLEFIRRSSKSQGLSWAGIESQSDLVQLRLREPGQVGVLWQILPQ